MHALLLKLHQHFNNRILLNLLSWRNLSLWSRIPGWISALSMVILGINSALWGFFLILLPSKSRWIWILSGLPILLHLGLSMQNPTPVIQASELPQYGNGTIIEMTKTAKAIRAIVEFPYKSNTLKILLRLPSQSELLPGDSISWHIKFDPLEPLTIPGKFDSQKWLQSQGALASGKALNVQLHKANHRFTTARFAFALRNQLNQFLHRQIPFKEAGILQAVLVGDKSGLDKETLQNFRDTGLIHALTVSGFHVVYISIFLQVLFAAMRSPPWLSRLLVLIFLGFYLPITGSSPAIQRAIFMFFLLQLTAVLQRRPPSLNTLGVATSIILAVDPQSLYDIGLQLSCGATAGILLGQNKAPWRNIKIPGPIKNYIVDPTWITLCATAATFPLLVLHFQSFAPIGLVANLLVVPLLALALEAGFWLLLFHPIDIFAQGFGQSAALLIELATKITAYAAQMPGAGWVVGPWPSYVAIVVLVGALAIPHALNHHRFAQFLVLTSISVWAAFSVYNQPQFLVTFLDAGQGDCTLLQFPNGKNIIIDAGNAERQGSFGKESIATYLRVKGISSIDALIITHPDLDHYGGAVSLINSVSVKSIWITRAARLCDKKDWEIFMHHTQQKQIPIYTAEAGSQLMGLGIWKFTWLFSPSDNWNNDWNETSQVVLVSDSIARILLPGDLGDAGEEILLEKLKLPQNTLLKLGHHGSRNSSSMEWLHALKPSIAIISSGRNNRYKHPSKHTLMRLDSLDIPYLNTAQRGSIYVKMNSKNQLEIESQLMPNIP